jgi:hypothetical protein
MTEAHAAAPVPAGQAFDAALARGRAALAEPAPDLPKVKPEQTAARMVASLRGALAARFAHAAPAARAAALHRKAVADLVRVERQLLWRHRRIAVAGVLKRYWLPVLGVGVAFALAALAITYRDAIIASARRLWPAASAPVGPAAPPASQPPGQGPAGAVPPASATGPTP